VATLTFALGALFHSTINGAEGWDKDDCLLSDARLRLVDESGAETTSGRFHIYNNSRSYMLTNIHIVEGELIIRSRFVTKGYRQYDNSPFTQEDDGTVSFRTGDIYGYVADQRLVWRGRKEDYIQARFFYFISIFLCSYIYHPF
jgi:long-subunit acyl-CoA synthetase (AMP-forming)